MPDRLYLGRTQQQEIEKHVETLRSFAMLVAPVGSMRLRPQFDGMLIFFVDADSHLEFGFSQPSTCG